MSTADISKMTLDLLIVRQERDDACKERDLFKQFYKMTSQRAEELVSRNRGDIGGSEGDQ